MGTPEMRRQVAEQLAGLRDQDGGEGTMKPKVQIGEPSRRRMQTTYWNQEVQ